MGEFREINNVSEKEREELVLREEPEFKPNSEDIIAELLKEVEKSEKVCSSLVR